MSNNNIDINIVKYISFDGMPKLWLKIIQIRYSAFKAHLRIICGNPHVCPVLGYRYKLKAVVLTNFVLICCYHWRSVIDWL